jgi:hypothetical protein
MLGMDLTELITLTIAGMRQTPGKIGL